MKTNVIRMMAILMVIGLIIGVIGCAAPAATTTTPATSTTTATPPKELKIGLLTPITGPAAQWGRAQSRAHEMGFEDVNAAGGLKVGDDTYMIKLVTYDHKLQATEAVAGVNKMIFQDGIKFLTTHTSTPTLAVLPITTQNKIFTTCNGYAKMVIPEFPLNYRSQYTGVEASEGVYGYIVNNLNLKTSCLIGNDDDTGKSSVTQAANIATSAGINMLDKQYVPRGTQDFYPVLAKMLTFNSDMIDVDAMAPADVAIFIKQARERGYKGLIVATAQNDIKLIMDVAGAAYAEGYIQEGLDFSSTIATPEQRDFYNRYTKKYNESWDPLCGSYYAHPMTFAAGITAAQSIDPEKVAAKLQDITFKVLGVEASWGGLQRYGIKHQIVFPIYVSGIKDGRFTSLGKYTPQVP